MLSSLSSCVCMCGRAVARVSHAGIVSKRLFVCRFPSTYPTMYFSDIRISPPPKKIHVLPSGTLPQTMDLQNLAIARSASPGAIQTTTGVRALGNTALVDNADVTRCCLHQRTTDRRLCVQCDSRLGVRQRHAVNRRYSLADMSAVIC